MSRPLRACVPAPASSSGFGLLETLLCSALIAVLVGGAASSLLVAQRSSGRQEGLSRLDALIDQDLASIQAADRRLTCCSGACTDGIPSPTPDSCESTPGNENYYAPKQDATTTANQQAAMVAFVSRCQAATANSSIATSLLPVQNNSQYLQQSPLRIGRQVELIDSAANRLRITYTGSISGTTVSTRVVDLIPTAAGWCP